MRTKPFKDTIQSKALKLLKKVPFVNKDFVCELQNDACEEYYYGYTRKPLIQYSKGFKFRVFTIVWYCKQLFKKESV